MKGFPGLVLSRLGSGLIVIVPVYLCILLLLKVMSSMAALVRPIAVLLPEWLPRESLAALLLLLILCLLVGVIVRTAAGRVLKEKIERSLFQRLPGYALVRSLTQQITGGSGEEAWRPALIEIEEALVPAFIIEELDDGRYTVFVPSVPTPLAGAIYILDPERVHLLEARFTQAIKVVSRWGLGSKELVAAMKGGEHPDRSQADVSQD